MSKTKIKLYSFAGSLALFAVVLTASPVFVSSAAPDDIINEIAGYKSWQRINKAPIKIIAAPVASPLKIDATVPELADFQNLDVSI